VTRREALAWVGAPLLLLVCERSGAQAVPALQSYDVELVVFRNLSSNASAEQWAMENNAANVDAGANAGTDADAAAEAAPTTAPSTTFPPLPPARLQLTAIADTLKRSRRYQPVAHFGWTQPGYARNDARFTSVESLLNASSGASSSGLTGRIALARGRYLHLTLDLSLDGEDGQRYQLQQTRRMRSNERHYLDHPKFGVVALITPSEG